MIHSSTATDNNSKRTNLRTEVLAGLSTYLTLSYIFLLNPLLLNRVGIDISAAFAATCVSAGLATLLMGVWAKLPFAVAPAPSITTFFVSYVCIASGLPWEAALGAVILSGLLSLIMTSLSVRGKLIESIPAPLKTGVLLAICGFLLANGLSQAGLLKYSQGWIDPASFNTNSWLSGSTVVLMVGLLTTLLLRIPAFKFAGAPLIGIIAAAFAANALGFEAGPKAEFSVTAMTSAAFKADISFLFDPRFLVAMLIFFIIDFFGGVGKYIALFSALGRDFELQNKEKIGRALYVDGWGNVFGGFLGASSLAVFVSSAVGIASGGKSGLVSIVTAMLMFGSLLFIPLVGTIPNVATSGILVFVAFLLFPTSDFLGSTATLSRLDMAVAIAAATVSFLTYGIDKAILLVFLVYTVSVIRKGIKRENTILLVTTGLLLAAVIAQTYIR